MSIAAACAARARVIETGASSEDVDEAYKACKAAGESLSREAQLYFEFFLRRRVYLLITEDKVRIQDCNVDSDIPTMTDEIMAMPIMRGARAHITTTDRPIDDVWTYHVRLEWPQTEVKSARKTG